MKKLLILSLLVSLPALAQSASGPSSTMGSGASSSPGSSSTMGAGTMDTSSQTTTTTETRKQRKQRMEDTRPDVEQQRMEDSSSVPAASESDATMGTESSPSSSQGTDTNSDQ